MRYAQAKVQVKCCALSKSEEKLDTKKETSPEVNHSNGHAIPAQTVVDLTAFPALSRSEDTSAFKMGNG